MAFRCVEVDKGEILFGGHSAVAISACCGNEGGHCNSIYKASKLEEGSLESGSIGAACLERRGALRTLPRQGMHHAPYTGTAHLLQFPALCR